LLSSNAGETWSGKIDVSLEMLYLYWTDIRKTPTAS